MEHRFGNIETQRRFFFPSRVIDVPAKSASDVTTTRGTRVLGYTVVECRGNRLHFIANGSETGTMLARQSPP